MRHGANFKMRSRRFCISNVPMHSISDPLKTRRWNLGCTVHGTASLEPSNLRIRMTTRALRHTRVKNAVEGRRRNKREIQRERPSRCERAKTGEDGERCCVLKGDIPWMIFYSWPSSPSATSTSSKSPQSRWCRSCRTAVSSASKRGLEAWSDGFHDSMGSPQSTLALTPDLTLVPTSTRFSTHVFTFPRIRSRSPR